MTAVYVAAGSNIDPVKHLSKALEELRRIYPDLQMSPAYRNKAVGFEGEDFINLVVGFTTDQSVQHVREQLQAVEKLCGRPPDAPKWAARSMDLDILLYGDLVSNEPGLVIPRPDLLRRPYMLKPMADVAPHVRHPLANQTMRELWTGFDSDGHEMLAVPLTSLRFDHRPPR